MSDRERRRLVTATKRGLRDLRIELSVLNHRVSNRVELKDIDFDCLDVIVRHGPLAQETEPSKSKNSHFQKWRTATGDPLADITETERVRFVR